MINYKSVILNLMKNNPVTSLEVATALNITAKRASSWLSRLVGDGLVQVIGQLPPVKNKPGRPVKLYKLK